MWTVIIWQTWIMSLPVAQRYRVLTISDVFTWLTARDLQIDDYLIDKAPCSLFSRSSKIDGSCVVCAASRQTIRRRLKTPQPPCPLQPIGGGAGRHRRHYNTYCISIANMTNYITYTTTSEG